MTGTRKSFGGDVRAPGAAAPFYGQDGDGGDGVSFGFLVRQSAAAIERGRALIDARGADLARAATARASGEAMLAAWGARLFIALFWVFVGVVLAREAAAGYPVRGLDAAGAATLARIFVAVGVLGAVAAFIGGYLVRAGETSYRGEAGFGGEAGRIARDFAETAAQLKDRIGRDGASAADLSRLHLIAVEAVSFLEGVSFLSEPDHRRAEEKFSAFLDRHSPPPRAGGGSLLLILGAVIGAVAASGGWPRLGAAGLPLWAVAALPGLALFYALLGAVFTAAGAAPAGSAPAKTRHAILAGLRKAYVEAGAPRTPDLLREIEAAVAAGRTAGR